MSAVRSGATVTANVAFTNNPAATPANAECASVSPIIAISRWTRKLPTSGPMSATQIAAR
jgi:hypothetical protein